MQYIVCRFFGEFFNVVHGLGSLFPLLRCLFDARLLDPVCGIRGMSNDLPESGALVLKKRMSEVLPTSTYQLPHLFRLLSLLLLFCLLFVTALLR